MMRTWSVRVTSTLLYVVGFAASLRDAVQSDILVDPVFSDDDDSALLVPVLQAPPGRALRAGTKMRTAAPALALPSAVAADKKQEPASGASNKTSNQETEGNAKEPPAGGTEGTSDQDNAKKPASHAREKTSNQEQFNRLIDSLIGPETHYHKHLRPLPDCSAHDCSHKIGVTMSLEFQKLLGVDEKANQLEMLAVLSLNWADHRLAYNSSKWFPHLFDWQSESDFVAIDPHLIWQPDIQLVNAAEPMQRVFQPRAFVYDDKNRMENGFNVKLKVPNIIKVKCDLVMDDFPFDNQTCNFVYQAWSATTDWISFTATKTINTNETISQLTSKNEEFEVTSVEKEDSTVKIGQQVFPQIIYTLKMSRYSHYYVSSIILPMLMMVLLSVGVFYIDPPGGERLGFNITLILTVMATSFFAAERLPKSGGGDTWLERFQAGCYIITITPLVVSLFCELFRRIALKNEMAGEDDGGWITYLVDHIFRVPYAICTAIFIWVVSHKFYTTSGRAEESVFALLIFLFTAVIVMCIVGVVDLTWELWRWHSKKS